MECDHTTTLDCVHHEHSSPGHGIEMVHGNMGCDHTTTLDCVHHEHSSPGHGIEMMRDNMGCDHTIAWNCPINSKGMRAKRCGRGYPEGVIPSQGRVDEHSETYPV